MRNDLWNLGYTLSFALPRQRIIPVDDILLLQHSDSPASSHCFCLVTGHVMHAIAVSRKQNGVLW